MQVSVKSNIKEITKWTTNAQKKQIPFATSVAINNTLFDLKKEMEILFPTLKFTCDKISKVLKKSKMILFFQVDLLFHKN